MSLGEFDIIARYFSRSGVGPSRTKAPCGPLPAGGAEEVLLGIGDDAAVLDVRAGCKLVVAVDTIVAEVHFPAGMTAEDVGYRALAVNLSDLAAMGAEPAWMTLSLSLPEADERWLESFAAGLFELADLHGVALVGGDTVRGPLVITVQVAGWVEADGWLTRAGARPGDLLMVSGVPGEAAGGLALWQRGATQGAAAEHLLRRFRRPEPRLALGRQLRTLASAAMDVSDGLLTDLHKLCAASGCGAQLDIDALPVSAAMQACFEPQVALDHTLGGGDDYELLFTVPVRHTAALHSRSLPVGVTQIGVITAQAGVHCRRAGQPYVPQHAGYEHFAPPGA